MPNDADNEQLVKIIIDAYDDTLGVGGEGLWAKPLGDDLYEIRNTPWHTFEVNWGMWFEQFLRKRIKSRSSLKW